MKRLSPMVFMVLLGMLFVFQGPGPAQAVLYDFDSLTAGQNIVDLGDFAITVSDGGSVRVTTAPDDDYGVGYISQYNAITTFKSDGTLDGLISLMMTITFETPYRYVSFYGGDRGGDFDQFTADAYDASDTLLTSFTTPLFGGSGIPISDGFMRDNYHVVFDNIGDIKKVVIYGAINFGIGIDSLEYSASSPVPEPHFMLLLGSGLIGLFGLRRKVFFKK